MKTLKTIFFLAIAGIMVACGTSKETTQATESSGSEETVKEPVLRDHLTFLITEVSKDETYGYTQENPIMVGGVTTNEGPLNERRFLNALAGPNGESISYNRQGSCCHFETENGFMGGGLLDMYEVTWSGQKEAVILYINMYDPGELKAPVGFTIRKFDSDK